MPKGTDEDKSWQNLVETLGFRQAVLWFLRDRLAQEGRKERVVGLVGRLGKYEPQLEILDLLRLNPVWRQQLEDLIADLPEVNAEPEIHFTFTGDGNVPNTPELGDGRLFFGSGESFYAVDAETAEILWRLQSPGRSWTTAWLSNNCLFACSAGTLYALSPSDGREYWRFQVEKRLSSPYSSGDRIFVGSEEGTVYALQAGSGRRLWTFNVVKSVFVATGIWQDKIFAASRDHCLYAIRVTDGECQWHFVTGGKIYANPFVSDGVVYLASADHKIYGLLAASGQSLWSFSTGGEIRASPLEKDGLLYVCSRDGHLYVLNADDGKQIWRRKTVGYPSSPSVSRGMIYFSAQGRVYGFSVEDRKLRWCFPSGAAVATSPVVGNKRIYVGTLQGRLFCLRLNVTLDEQGATLVLKRFVHEESEPDLE